MNWNDVFVNMMLLLSLILTVGSRWNAKVKKKMVLKHGAVLLMNVSLTMTVHINMYARTKYYESKTVNMDTVLTV